MTPSPASARPAEAPPAVLLDTDMGNDIDDALALAMLHELERRGECRLAGVAISKDNPWAAVYTRLVNARCGRPEIPVGMVREGATPEDGPFLRRISEPLAQPSPEEDAVDLLRRLLAQQPDHGAVILSIGFFTNLSRLLDSEADAHSPLRGRDLLLSKVRFVCSMAGNFRPEESEGPDIGNPEFNIRTDIAAAKNFIERCPVPMVLSGFEIGAALLFPGEEIEKILRRDPGDPIAAGYAAYLPMPYDRQCWDQTAVLHAIRPHADDFELSPPGEISVDRDGYVSFSETPGGRRRYLILRPERTPFVREAIRELSVAFANPSL